MTKQADVIGNPNYIPVLDHGFVGLVDHMGNDSSIVQAARVSYGSGTKKVSEDRGLIRYLLKHAHTTPMEMVELKFHMKLPIFVARQLVRHRTASINEYSGRYSEMTDEFYTPELERIQPQSQLNKQGSDGKLHPRESEYIHEQIEQHNAKSYDVYGDVLANPDTCVKFKYDAPDQEIKRQGASRELSRIVLPVSNYTEWYWKIDLHNLIHFLKLRMDSHAQYEIQVYAKAMYELIKPIVPIAAEAAEDYVFQAVTLSRMEKNLLIDLVAAAKHNGITLGDDATIMKNYGLGKREMDEFKEKFDL